MYRSRRRIPALCFSLLLVLGCAAAGAQEITGFELALVDLRGKKKILGTLPTSVFAPRVSPDGRQLAFELADPVDTKQPPSSRRLWIADLAHPEQRRELPLVGPGQNWAAIWSTDGKRLVFLVSGSGPDSLYWRSADGSGEAERLVEARAAEGMSADGRRLMFITLVESATGERDYGISMLDLQTRAITPLIDRPGSQQHSSRISPDGRWLAYASNETGRMEVWLEPLPQTGKRYAISPGGGSHPLWAADGETLYFDLENRLYSVKLFLGAEAPKASDPKGLEIRGFQQGGLRRQYDIMPDGKRFVMLFPVRAGSSDAQSR
jgi:Tol biopolymer transport system component